LSRYFFQAQYRGSTLTDHIGEEFSTRQEAEAHAAVVAKELGRNGSEAIMSCAWRRRKSAGVQRGTD
jgi:uncharacterized protein DUF6894